MLGSFSTLIRTKLAGITLHQHDTIPDPTGLTLFKAQIANRNFLGVQVVLVSNRIFRTAT